tara:strand:+ start:834 stop:977 length:144 start_codon:yes stop_codon:yes gene_type:complete
MKKTNNQIDDLLNYIMDKFESFAKIYIIIAGTAVFISFIFQLIKRSM